MNLVWNKKVLTNSETSFDDPVLGEFTSLCELSGTLNSYPSGTACAPLTCPSQQTSLIAVFLISADR